MPETVSPVIAQARKQWARCADAEEDQRKAILAAKQFRALKQWPDALVTARKGAASLSGQPPQPARPCLVVDRLSQPVRQISNTIKNADFGFDVMPNGDGADIETADIIKGYLRRVQNQSRGESPIEWAADQAIEGGIGWFRIKTRYVHETWDGDPNDPEAYDQELVLERLPNNLAVYDDPSANKPTRSDALFRFIVEDMDKDAFKARFPKADLRGLEEFQSTGDMAAWVSKDMIRVAEYWRVTFKDRKIWATKDGRSGEGDPPKDGEVLYKRTVRKPIVKGSLINAVEELETFDWVGSRIPSVPILGEELNIDGKAKLRGIIEMGMDAQRMVNFTYSAGVEIFALEPRKAPMVVAGSVAAYKNVWDTRNIYNWSYHPYDQYDENGREYRQPQQDISEAPIQAAVMLMRTSEEALKASTSTGDASLGNSNPNERSGRALQALQVQSELANSNYPDNVRRALIYAAELMVEVIPKITRPGQILHIMGLDDQPDQVMVGQPFQKNAAGIPEPAPEGVTPEIAKLKDNLYKFYDPTAGRYAVTVTVGKASATRREEGAAALGELIPHLPPEMAAVVTPDYVKQLSFPGAQGIAERLESVLPAHLKPQKDGAQAMPPEAQQQIAGLTQQLQEAQQALATDKVKTDGQIQIKQMDIDFQREKLAVESEVKIAVAELSAKVDRMALFFDERARVGTQAHDVGMSALEHAQKTDLASQQHDQALEAGEQGANLAMTQAEHAQAIAPPEQAGA
jgi:hypothetical protein